MEKTMIVKWKFKESETTYRNRNKQIQKKGQNK